MPPKRRRCCTRAETTWSRCARRLHVCATPVWPRPGDPEWSPTRARCSSPSPACVGTAATTAPSPRSRTGSTRPSCPRTRCSRSPGPAPRPAAKKRCSPWGTGRRSGGRLRASWLESRGYDSTLAYLRAMAVLVLEETGLLPHLNPGVMSWQEMARLRPVVGVHGDDAGDDVARAVRRPERGALRQPRQGPGRAAAGAGRQRTPGGPVHHGGAGGHRGDLRRPGRVAAPHPGGGAGVRARPRGAGAELPVQARHGDAPRRRPAR